MSLLSDVRVTFIDNSLGVRDSENAGHLRWKSLYLELSDLTFVIFSSLHCVLPFSLRVYTHTLPPPAAPAHPGCRERQLRVLQLTGHSQSLDRELRAPGSRVLS